MFRKTVIACALAGSGALALPMAGHAAILAGPQAQVMEAATTQPVRFEVFLPIRNREGLEQLIQDQQTVGSPHYHQWLTPQQFAAQFGPTKASIARVTAALEAGGLKISHVHSRSLTVEGSVGAVNQLFATRLNTVREAGRSRFVAERLAMPAALSAEGAVIADFANVPLKHSMARNLGAIPENRYSNVGSYWYDDLKQAYDYPSVQALDGTGANIAVLMEFDVLDSDIQKMFDHENYTLTTGKPDPGLAGRFMVNGGAPFDPNGSFEASLDVQQVLGGAPGAAVTLFDIPDLSDANILSGYLDIVEYNQWDVVNSSFGGCEMLYSAKYNGGQSYYGILDTYDTLFMQGNSQGITFVASSGDEGGLICPSVDYFYGSRKATWVKGVSSPASSPHVTSVGGTNLITTTPPDPQPTPPVLTSAYVGENAFGDPEVPYDPYGLGANVSGGYWGAGGGISDHFKAPSYQKLVDAGNDGMRTLPDVGMQVGGCPGGISVQPCGANRSSAVVVLDGGLYGVIGTSVSSPEFVGALALDIQKTGGRLGQVNNFLYQRAAEQNAAGGIHAPAQFQYYHRAIPGFDGFYRTHIEKQVYNYITGNGTPDVRLLFGLQDMDAAGDPQTPSNP